MLLGTALLLPFGRLIDTCGKYAVTFVLTLLNAAAALIILMSDTRAQLFPAIATLIITVQLVATALVPLTTSCIPDSRNVGRDFTVGMGVVPLMSDALFMPVVGQVIPMFGTSGRTMLGGRQ